MKEFIIKRGGFALVAAVLIVIQYTVAFHYNELLERDIVNGTAYIGITHTKTDMNEGPNVLTEIECSHAGSYLDENGTRYGPSDTDKRTCRGQIVIASFGLGLAIVGFIVGLYRSFSDKHMKLSYILTKAAILLALVASIVTLVLTSEIKTHQNDDIHEGDRYSFGRDFILMAVFTTLALTFFIADIGMRAMAARKSNESFWGQMLGDPLLGDGQL